MINVWNYKKFLRGIKQEIVVNRNQSKGIQIDEEIYANQLVFGNNIIGYPFEIVPNIVDYILFTIHEIRFSHFISLLSFLRNQKPYQIIIHYNCDQLNGEYYKYYIIFSKSFRRTELF
jgi:hypothetical protein